MSDLNCIFKARETDNYLDVHKFCSPRYEMKEEAGTLCIKIHCALSSGVSYKNGTGVFKDGCIYLDAEQHSGEMIAFELVPWELTYKLAFRHGPQIEAIFFRNERAIDNMKPPEAIELPMDYIKVE